MYTCGTCGEPIYDEYMGCARCDEEEQTKPFPVLGVEDAWIPWFVASTAYESYAREFGTSQSLERIAERGGFAVSELDDLYPGWRDHPWFAGSLPEWAAQEGE